jgi:hypothetical protein
MITHIKFSKPWKEYQVGYQKQTNPCYKMGKDGQYFFILFQWYINCGFVNLINLQAYV